MCVPVTHWTSTLLKAESDFAFPVEGTRSESQQARQTRETSFLRKYSNMPNADVILQSSDLVDFYVNRSVLIASSLFFGDLFSLPQPQNDGLPSIHLSEDAETFDSLISMLYPVFPEIPFSSDKALTLLAAVAKYDMDAVQSSIRGEINQRGLLSLTFAESFRVYAVAYSRGLIPEMESSARLTLSHPLTFESLGDTLRLFEGRALRDLADFRQRSIRNFASNSQIFFECHRGLGPSGILAGCHCLGPRGLYPYWLEDCFWFRLGPAEDRLAETTYTIPTDAQLRGKYLKVFRTHVKKRDCRSCLTVHALEGEKYWEMTKKDILVTARNVPFVMG